MFDELRDPQPPDPAMANLSAVTARAKQLRTRRYLAMGAAGVAVLAIGAGTVVALNGDGGEGLAPADPTTVETTVPVTTLPATTVPGSTMPGSTLVETTAPDSTTQSPAVDTTVPGTTGLDTTTLPMVVDTTVETTVVDTTVVETTEPASTAPTSTDPPPSVCVGPESGLLAVVDGNAMRIRPDGTVEPLIHPDEIGGAVQRVLEAPDGTLWLQVPGAGSQSSVGTFTNFVYEPLRTGKVTLDAVGSLGGTSIAAIIDAANPENIEAYGRFELVDAAGTALVTLPEPFAPEHSVSSVSVTNDVIAVGYHIDLGERFSFHDADGGDINRYDPNTGGTPGDPTDDPIQYGLPPFAIAPMQLGGGEVAWLEGSEYDQRVGETTGDWQLVIAAQETGAERVRVRIGDTQERYISHDTDGRWLVLNYGEGDPGKDPTPTRSVIIDLAAAEPVAVDVCGEATNVSLTRT